MSYHVLIVEDEPSLSDYVKKELIFEDYQVSTAFDALSALEIFETAKPAIDVVLLDWMIPKLDGLTVLRRMKKIQPIQKIKRIGAADVEVIPSSAKLIIFFKGYLLSPAKRSPRL